MQDYDENWAVARGKTTIKTSTRHQIEIRCSCTQDVQLLGLRGKEEIPLKIGREFRIRAKTKGFEALILKGKPQVDYGYRVAEIIRQDGEPINHDNPPSPPMPGANNLVAQMRRVVQQEMDRHRAPVLDPEDLPFSQRYTLEDDQDEIFEEEIIERQKAELLKSQQDPEPDPDPNIEDPALTPEAPVPEAQSQPIEPPAPSTA